MATSPAEVIRPLRRVEYDQLVALGAFQDERIELLEGELVAMSPIGAPHSSTVQRLNRLLVLALEGRAGVRCQLPFAALEFSEPEPDFVLVPGSDDYHADHPSEAYLIIEVSESSLALDRGKKLRLYASCGVPEYWVVNLPESCIEVYSGPSPGAYAKLERYERGQAIHLLAFPDVAFAVSDVLK
ncbi:MAG TPA: Uma2 family endonuclease [Polyangiaceae bacterium]|nr:Uma2 family endonuclease [Polyangiaceae bacterium]